MAIRDETRGFEIVFPQASKRRRLLGGQPLYYHLASFVKSSFSYIYLLKANEMHNVRMG